MTTLIAGLIAAFTALGVMLAPAAAGASELPTNPASLDLTKNINIPQPSGGSNGTQILDLRETASAAVGGSSGSGSASSGPSHIKGANSVLAASILNIGNAG